MNIKQNMFQSMLHITPLWYFDTSVIYSNDFVESNLLQYHHVLYSSNICEILLYLRHVVIITHELIYGVQACRRKIVVKQDYSVIVVHQAAAASIPAEGTDVKRCSIFDTEYRLHAIVSQTDSEEYKQLTREKNSHRFETKNKVIFNLRFWTSIFYWPSSKRLIIGFR